jgi:hypothetical protein
VSAPLGVLTGLGVAVAAAAVDRPALAAVGVLVAGVPGLYHSARSAVLENELRAAAAARRLGPVAGSASAVAPEHVTPEPPGSAFGLVDARIDTGELQRIWDLGEGPDTGQLPAVTAPLATVAEPKVLVGVAAAGEPTRALELPSRRGRHAAGGGPLDAPAGVVSPAPRLEVVRSRGRHAAA